jgi:hypothetical protein
MRQNRGTVLGLPCDVEQLCESSIVGEFRVIRNRSKQCRSRSSGGGECVLEVVDCQFCGPKAVGLVRRILRSAYGAQRRINAIILLRFYPCHVSVRPGTVCRGAICAHGRLKVFPP